MRSVSKPKVLVLKGPEDPTVQISVPPALEQIMRQHGLEIEVMGQISISLEAPSAEGASASECLKAFRKETGPIFTARIPNLRLADRKQFVTFYASIEGAGKSPEEAVAAFVRALSGKNVAIGRGQEEKFFTMPIMTTHSHPPADARTTAPAAP